MNTKLGLVALFLALMLTGPASAQKITLQTSSGSAYSESVIAMGEAMGIDGVLRLATKLLVLAAGPVPPGTSPEEHQAAASELFTADEQAYLDAIQPFEGMTAKQIMAIEQPGPPGP
jgi:hypothetical protein